MISITDESSKITIVDSTGKSTVINNLQPSITISSVGSQGISYSPEDLDIVTSAGDGNKTFVYDGLLTEQLNQINIADVNGATNHIKVFNYKIQTGDTVLDTLIDSFDYNSQKWTTTKTFLYDASLQVTSILQILTKV
jgi:hypothetical protein